MKTVKRIRNRKARELALMQSAATLFSLQGVERTTTRQIADNAKCAEGLISRYFKGKRGLAKAVEENAERLTIPSPALLPRYADLNFDSILQGELNPKQKLAVNRMRAALEQEFAA